MLPALLRKMHLGKALEDNNWQVIRKDLEKLPITGVQGTATEEEIRAILKTNGIEEKEGAVKIEIWGSGKPMREFLWSEDMAYACVFLMENRNFEDCYNLQEKEIRNTHINIGTGKDVTIKNLAELLKETIGFKGTLYFNTDKPDGTLKKLTDVSKLHKMGWSHTIELKEGIKQMYEWYCK